MKRRGKTALWTTTIVAALALLVMAQGVLASNTVTLPLFEPEAFFRDTGGPDMEVRTFTIPAIQGDFTLSLDNGSAAGDSLTSAAVVKVNGFMVIKTSDLNQQVTHLERDLNPYVNKGENILEVEVRSIPSSYITISINGVYLLDVQVTDPVAGSSLDADKATVQGTWEAYTDDMGIVVNGVPAALAGGVFVASDVPLVAGTNTLTATVTTFEEIRDTAFVDVTASGEEPMVAIWVNLSSGVAPLGVTFGTDISGIDAVEYRYDFDGNGVVDIYASTDSAVSYTYQYAGVYNASVTVIDTSAQEYTSTLTEVIEDLSQMGPILTGRWDDVSASLTAQDVQGAMVFFLPESRVRYEGFLEAIKSQLPAVHQSLPAPVFVKASGDTAEYLVTREQVFDGVSRPIAYSIFFQRDPDGIWRIREY